MPTPPNRNKFREQTESLSTEMKDAMDPLKTLASDTYSKEILDVVN